MRANVDREVIRAYVEAQTALKAAKVAAQDAGQLVSKKAVECKQAWDECKQRVSEGAYLHTDRNGKRVVVVVRAGYDYPDLIEVME